MECNYYQTPKISKHLDAYGFLLFTVMFDEWKMMKNEDGWFYRSLESLHKDTGMSLFAIRNRLSSFIKMGIMEVVNHNDGKVKAEYNKANEYRFNMDVISQLSKKGTSDNTFESECESQDTEKGTSDNTFESECESQDTEKGTSDNTFESEKVVKITTFNEENSKEGYVRQQDKGTSDIREGYVRQQPSKEIKTKEEITNNKNISATVYSALENNNNFKQTETMDSVTLEIEGLIGDIGHYMNNLKGKAGDVYWNCIVNNFHRLKEIMPQENYAEVRKIFKEELKANNIDTSRFTS